MNKEELDKFKKKIALLERFVPMMNDRQKMLFELSQILFLNIIISND